MSNFLPAHLADITQGSWHGGAPGVIKGFHFDTRRVEPGQCFVALQSDSRDGHDFVGDAIFKGSLLCSDQPDIGLCTTSARCGGHVESDGCDCL